MSSKTIKSTIYLFPILAVGLFFGLLHPVTAHANPLSDIFTSLTQTAPNTPTATPTPTAAPTSTPSPTPVDTATPTAKPTAIPTVTPSTTPVPTAVPTVAPTISVDTNNYAQTTVSTPVPTVTASQTVKSAVATAVSTPIAATTRTLLAVPAVGEPSVVGVSTANLIAGALISPSSSNFVYQKFMALPVQTTRALVSLAAVLLVAGLAVTLSSNRLRS